MQTGTDIHTDRTMTDKKTDNKGRCRYFDFLRGIAIIMVVGIHTWSGGNFETAGGCVLTILRQPLNGAVPIFLAISGYFLSRKVLSDRQSIWAFWKRQLPKVYVPVLIWSLPLLLLGIRISHNVTPEVIKYLVCGDGVFYFIAVIMQFYILLPVLTRITRSGMILCTLISVISIFAVTYAIYMRGIAAPLILYAGHAGLWLVFFVMGIALQRFRPRYSRQLAVWLSVSTLLLQVAEAHFLYSSFRSGAGIKLSSFMFSASIILLLFHPRTVGSYRENGPATRCIRFMGNISFGIYLIHILPITAFSYTPFYNGMPWLAKFAAVLPTTVLLIMAMRRLLPKRLLRVLGV